MHFSYSITFSGLALINTFVLASSDYFLERERLTSPFKCTYTHAKYTENNHSTTHFVKKISLSKSPQKGDLGSPLLVQDFNLYLFPHSSLSITITYIYHNQLSKASTFWRRLEGLLILFTI